jgi:hypothetical protein
MLGGTLLLFAFEGLLCIAMAAPIALVVGMFGGWIGRELALRSRHQPSAAMLTVLAIPLLSLSGPARGPLPTHEVLSSIEIAAPPTTVWRHVVSFAELPPPREWLFHTGVAYPVRAHRRRRRGRDSALRVLDRRLRRADNGVECAAPPRVRCGRIADPDGRVEPVPPRLRRAP